MDRGTGLKREDGLKRGLVRDAGLKRPVDSTGAIVPSMTGPLPKPPTA